MHNTDRRNYVCLSIGLYGHNARTSKFTNIANDTDPAAELMNF